MIWKTTIPILISNENLNFKQYWQQFGSCMREVRLELSSKPWVVCVATRTTVWGYRTQVRKMLTGMALEIFVTQMLTTMAYPTVQ